MARINRAHDGVLQQDVRAGHRCLPPHRSEQIRLFPWEAPPRYPGRSIPGNVRSLIALAATAAPVWPALTTASALSVLHQIDRAADGGIFFSPHRFDRADRSSPQPESRGRSRFGRSLQPCFFSSASIWVVSPTRKSLSIWRIFAQRHDSTSRRDWAGRNRHPWHQARSSSGAEVCGLTVTNAKSKYCASFHALGRATWHFCDADVRGALHHFASTVRTWRPL